MRQTRVSMRQFEFKDWESLWREVTEIVESAILQKEELLPSLLKESRELIAQGAFRATPPPFSFLIYLSPALADLYDAAKELFEGCIRWAYSSLAHIS